jgi:uncharacterized protein YjbJ (UPF0337 family)
VSWDDLRVRWDELAVHARNRWAKLTARDLRVIAGNRERLVGVLQLRYGAHRRTIEREVRAFTRSCEALAERPGRRAIPTPR